MFIVVCFVITVILHSVKAVICLFIRKTFTPEISLPKVREFFFMMKSCILHYLYMYSPWFVLVSGYACDISGRTGYPRKKKIDLQASIFLEYLILSKVGEIFLKAFIRVRNCVENFFFILQQKMMYMNIALHQVEKSMVMTWMFHLMTIYTNVNYFSIPLVIFDRYKQEEIF